MGVADVILSAGVLAAVIGGFITLVRIALTAERRRADDWRTAAQTSAAANKVMTANVDRLVVTVEQLAATQRDMMVLLQRAETERRSAV